MTQLMNNKELITASLPVVNTGCLAAALADYRDVMGFSVCQHIPGVLAVLRLGSLRLHLWQRAAPTLTLHPGKPVTCYRVPCESVFDLYKSLANRVPERIAAAPTLKPWGAWECEVRDGDGNVLRLVQWAVNSAFALGAPANQPTGQL